MNEYIVALASTDWRGWDEDEGPQCIEIAIRDCGVGWIEILFRGDITELAEMVDEAIREAERRELPLTWQFQDLCYAEPMDAAEVRLRTANWLRDNARHCAQCSAVFEPNDAVKHAYLDEDEFCSEWCADQAWDLTDPEFEEEDA